MNTFFKNILSWSFRNLLILFPMILIGTIWLFINPQYKTLEFVTLFFTVISFFLSFFIQKLRIFIPSYIKKYYFTFSILLFVTLVLVTIYRYSESQMNYILIIATLIIIYSVHILLYNNYIDFYKIMFEKKYKDIKEKNLLKEDFLKEEEDFFQKSKFDFKLNNKEIRIWKNIIMHFSTYHKKESLGLAKKNKIMEKIEYESKEDKPSFLDVFSLQHYTELFNTFHSSILAIEKERKKEEKIEKKEEISFEREKYLLSNLIFKYKIMHYNASIFITYQILFSTLKHLINFILSMFFLKIILDILGAFPFNSLGKILGEGVIQYPDVLMFIIGINLLYMTIPISYIYFTHLKFKNLTIWIDSNHIGSIIFFKNLFYYSSTFFITLLVIIFSITALAHSGVEYNQAFHFLATLILPMIELKDIPALLSYLFGDDIVFGIFMIKIFFLIFIFSIGVLLIQHFIELYIQEYDAHKSSRYSIPPEFTKFFSYLVLSIFALILMYGTLFINYPNLSREYNQCQPYLQEHYAYLNKSPTKKYCEDYSREHNSNKIQKVEKYIKQTCNEYLNSDTRDLKNTSLSANHCYILMKDYINNKNFIYNKDNNISTENNNTLIDIFIPNTIGEVSSSSKQELTDYLPLSIFLALFGTLIMLATKNLLENYFTGLSLKIDPPYDEGERIKLDDGEMLAVETIGFRATTFYGIESNAQLVIPHQKLTQVTITNYTQPTLDYREEITIYVPDTKHEKSIPREAEKILLLAAFISTGVKKPRISPEVEKIIKNDLKTYIQDIKEYKNKIDKNKDLSISSLKVLEKQEEDIINNIWKDLTEEKRYLIKRRRIKWYQSTKHSILKTFPYPWIECNKKYNKTQEELEKEKKDLFLNGIFKIVKDEETYQKSENSLHDLHIIKKLVISLYSVLYEYKKNNSLRYHIDEYLVKRKFKVFDNFKSEDKEDNKDRKRKKDELDKISNYLVNINYYYFALAKQLWQLKDKDDSTQKKKDFDHTSLELLDVPRVTSAHKRDIEGAFWEVTLLVTVELSEQSDEIIQHINMYVDELWEIFDLPYRCKFEDDNKTSIISKSTWSQKLQGKKK